MHFILYLSRCDKYIYSNLKQDLNLKADFNQFLTMLIKLINHCIQDDEKRRNAEELGLQVPEEKFKCHLIMNSDSTATLTFHQIMDFKMVNLLSLVMKLGDQDVINKHVSFKYKLVKNQMLESKAKLQSLVNTVKAKNPSLIAQINQSAMMISPPYHHLRIHDNPVMFNANDVACKAQNSSRSIKSRTMTNYSLKIKTPKKYMEEE